MDETEKMSEIFKLLGDKTRLTILALLKERECCVCELVDILQTSQPNVSQHIRKLKAGGLVRERRHGQWIYYSLNQTSHPALEQILGLLPSQSGRIEESALNKCPI
ncbi:ArsR/SmtB family transcription factor [Ferviditalea candida]|uniref:Metalloregulator ArsR/SmtB family transcription factor n=1 Tax=Ferviditalea candida TaxID=3108399 RepID=A0ABU5ZHM0_9BACL|nr:metalloregulator ArsR/SmtB family transcription factor [Paenibacillaceae bacterium T2]